MISELNYYYVYMAYNKLFLIAVSISLRIYMLLFPKKSPKTKGIYIWNY